MNSVQGFANWLRIDKSRPELMRAQFAALTTQVPLLYLILIINSALTASMFSDVAPLWMSFGVPLIAGVGLAWRAVVWMRWRSRRASIEVIHGRLVRTAVIGSAVSCVLMLWALGLYEYGDAVKKGYVVFYIGLTSVSCIMALMHLPVAALSVTGLVAAPFAAYLVLRGAQGAGLIALNMMLVVAVLVYVLYVYSRDFSRLITTTEGLARKSAEAAELGEENHRLAHRDALRGAATGPD